MTLSFPPCVSLFFIPTKTLGVDERNLKRVQGGKQISMSTKKYESAFAIGQRVNVRFQGVRLEGVVRAILFTSSKVRYSVRIFADETTLHNIDSAFVFSEPNAEVLDMPEDNYS